MDTQTALKTLSDLPAGNELLSLIQQYTPDWIISVLDGYAPNYQILHKNWDTYCKMLKTKPQKLLIVSHIEGYEEDQKEFTPIQQACDLLTIKGYCIRRDSEFMECEGKCGKAMATKELHRKLKNHPSIGGYVRGRWSGTCTKCS